MGKKKPPFRPSKEAAARSVHLHATVVATFTSLILLAYPWYVAITRHSIIGNIMIVVAYFSLKVVLKRFLASYFFYTGQDKTFQNGEEKRNLALHEKDKQEGYQGMEKLHSGYVMKTVSSSNAGVGAFLVTFETEIFLDIVPEIKVNGQPTSVKVLKKFTAQCTIDLSGKSSLEKLQFECSGTTILVDNPYYCIAEKMNHLLWQCEGTPKEKKILIPISAFPYATPATIFSFDLLIGAKGEKLATFQGMRRINGEFIVAPMPDIKKSQCVNKICTLRLAFDLGKTFPLPTPVVMSLNGKPVALTTSIGN